MSFFNQLFTWWNGQTLGTRLDTWWRGRAVGEDEEGNRFYQSKDGARRWVIYNGYSEASRVPAEWHGWLHHTYQEPPTVVPRQVRAWQKPHEPNATGTALAYRPPGSLLRPEPKQVARDYEAWTPE